MVHPFGPLYNGTVVPMSQLTMHYALYLGSIYDKDNPRSAPPLQLGNTMHANNHELFVLSYACTISWNVLHLPMPIGCTITPSTCLTRMWYICAMFDNTTQH